jgi:hypothetical protein
VPVAGAMPVGKKPWELASSSCGSSLLLSVSPPWRRKQVSRGSGGFPLNKLALVMSLICGKASCSLRALDAAMEVATERGRSARLELVDRVRAYLRWSSWRLGAGACIRGRWPAIVNMPSLLLAEGRPPLFLPAQLPLGRQFSSWLMAMVRSCGSLVEPSGFVPGDGEVELNRRLRTRLHISFSVWGPSCRVQGLICIFMFLQVLFVKCSVPE